MRDNFNKQRKELKMKAIGLTLVAVVAGIAASAEPMNYHVVDAGKEPPAVGKDASLLCGQVAPRRVVVMVQNHADPGTDIPMMALSDALTAHLSGRGFQIVNPYNSVGTNQNRTVFGEKTPDVSTMELARKLDAEGVVTASVLEFLDSTLGTPAHTHRYSIRVACNLADADTGAAICGDVVAMESPKYTNAQVAANRRKYLGDLLYAVAGECAARLESKAAGKPWGTAAGDGKKKFVLQEEFNSVVAGIKAELFTLRGAVGRNADIDGLKSEIGKMREELARHIAEAQARKAKKGFFSMSDLDEAINGLVAQMKADANFRQNYDIALKKANRIPLVVLGNIADETGGEDGVQGLTNLLAAARVTARVALFKSSIFDVKVDEEAVDIGARIVASGNSAFEDEELMTTFKKHSSPDFYLVGDLRFFKNENMHRLRLAIHSLLDGKVVWEGTIDK